MGRRVFFGVGSAWGVGSVIHDDDTVMMMR